MAVLSLFLAALAAGASPAAVADGGTPPPPAPRRLALQPLRATGVEAALVSLVESKLCEELGRASGWETVCPEDVAALGQLAKGEVSFGTCSTQECLDEMAALARSQRTVTGELTREGTSLVLSLSLLEGEGGRALNRAVEKLPQDPERLLERIPAVARKLWK